MEDFSVEVGAFHVFGLTELKNFVLQAVRSQITEAQKIATGSGGEQDIAEAKVELEASRIHQVISSRREKSDKACLGIGELASGTEVEIAWSKSSRLYNTGIVIDELFLICV